MTRPAVPAWLDRAVFYQVYPQSFLDANGDGIGDLPGLIQRLDYIRSLGCSALWLNPCFDSPFGDAGYDVADFYRIAPRYGTNDDLKRLCAEAHKRGLRVLLDLVAGHTSIEHPWFKASAKPEKNAFSNWYVWTDCTWSPTPSAHRFVHGWSPRDGAFLTNFYWCQPALNLGWSKPSKPWQLPVSHPDVQKVRAELVKIMRFWLDLGCDGFRVDMASSVVKNDTGYDLQGTQAYWREVREVFDRNYPEAVLISEWSNPTNAIPAGFHADFLLHFGHEAYNSLVRPNNDPKRVGESFLSREGKGDLLEFLGPYLKHLKKTRGAGYIALPSGNHDVPRLAHGRTVEELRVAMALFLTLPGLPFLYYGDEIGMRFLEGLPSKEGGYDRTGARTPMQWSRAPNAGFSTSPSEKIYLPVDPRPDRPTVESQEADRGSLLNHVRRLIALRNANPALQANGEFKPLWAKRKAYPFVYLREGKLEGKPARTQRVLVAINPSKKPVTVTLAGRDVRGEPELMLGSNVGARRVGTKLRLEMKGTSYALFRLE